ncbi:MAG: branched-chain amino acid ABC transporter permease [Clostridia bacterium]|nr:branched-chain amino acid ABC transporter permease [Clostridia bacterium]
MQKLIKKISPQTRSDFITYGIVIAAFVIIQILSAAGLLSSSFSGLLVPICAYVVMAVSLNLTVGILGELSLGHAGFMSIGAFSGVVAAATMETGVTNPVLRMILAMLAGGIIAGAAGFIIGIPVLRLRGDYLAIVTLAFGEIIKNIINCIYVGLDSAGLHFAMAGLGDVQSAEALGLNGGRVIINGPVGAVGVQKLSSFAIGFALVMLTLIIVLNIKRSRTGRAIMAVRDNRIAAESVGISITRYKMTAFIISAALAGMAGVLFAMNYTSIIAGKFNIDTSILVLVFVVLGGMGNIRGSIIATVILYMLPEMLRGFDNLRMMIYAIVLIAVMLFTNSDGAKQFREKVKMKFEIKKQAKKAGKGGNAA